MTVPTRNLHDARPQDGWDMEPGDSLPTQDQQCTQRDKEDKGKMNEDDRNDSKLIHVD